MPYGTMQTLAWCPLIENFLQQWFDSPPLFHCSFPSMSHNFPISMTSSFAFLGHSVLCANLLPGFTFQILFMCQRALRGMPVLLTHNFSCSHVWVFMVDFCIQRTQGLARISLLMIIYIFKPSGYNFCHQI